MKTLGPLRPQTLRSKGLALNKLMIDRTLCGQRRVQGIALVGVQG